MNSLVPLSELTPSALFGSLPVLKIKFTMDIPLRSRLPQYLGSTWRGLIGWELQRLICPFKNRPECKVSCTIQEHCPYYLLFEKETVRSGIRNAPRGYILYPPVQSQNGMDELEITLIGHCTRLLPVIVAAMVEGRSSGLGAERVSYDIAGLQEQLPGGHQQALSPDADVLNDVSGPFPLSDWLNNAPPSTDARAFFLTPMRLRKHGKYISQMDWPFFFAAIACRLEALHCLFHTGEPMGRETFKKLQTRFEPASKISAELQWSDYMRYSNRQDRKVPMGGLIGTVHRQLPLNGFEPWWQAASLLHVGKGASMGLGRVEMMMTE